MPALKFVLSDRQSACILDIDGSKGPSKSSVRKLFFSAEPSHNSAIDGKPCQNGNNVEVLEAVDNEIGGTVEACDAFDAYGKPTVVQADISLCVPPRTFEQLFNSHDEKIWLDLKVSEYHRDSVVAKTSTTFSYCANVTWARFSFQPIPKPQTAESKAISTLLLSILWVIIFVGAVIVWRLH